MGEREQALAGPLETPAPPRRYKRPASSPQTSLAATSERCPCNSVDRRLWSPAIDNQSCARVGGRGGTARGRGSRLTFAP